MPRSAKIRSLLLSMSIIALASCSSEGGTSSAKTAAPLPPITEMDAAMSAPAPQPLAASDTLTPVIPAAGTTTTVTTTTAAVPAVVSMEDRIARLEQTVGSLRSDYDRIMPAFASLNTTNERIQTLLDEIERDTGRRPVAAAATPATSVAETTTVTTTTSAPLSAPPAALTAPAPATSVKTETVKTETVKTETPAAAPAPAVSSSGANVTGVRIGEHGTKTRFVLDLSTKTKPEFKYDLDNAEKLLLVDLPSMGWVGNQAGKGGAAAPLVEGWNVQKGVSGGSTLAIQLKKNARILSTQFLPAEGKDPARLVMDIAAGN
jgi:hypothetical protein